MHWNSVLVCFFFKACVSKNHGHREKTIKGTHNDIQRVNFLRFSIVPHQNLIAEFE